MCVDATGSLSASLLRALGRIVTTDVQAEDWSVLCPGQPDRSLGSELTLTVQPRERMEKSRQAEGDRVGQLLRPPDQFLVHVQSLSATTLVKLQVDCSDGKDGDGYGSRLSLLPAWTFAEEGLHRVSVTVRGRHVCQSPLELHGSRTPRTPPPLVKWNTATDATLVT